MKCEICNKFMLNNSIINSVRIISNEHRKFIIDGDFNVKIIYGDFNVKFTCVCDDCLHIIHDFVKIMAYSSVKQFMESNKDEK